MVFTISEYMPLEEILSRAPFILMDSSMLHRPLINYRFSGDNYSFSEFTKFVRGFDHLHYDDILAFLATYTEEYELINKHSNVRFTDGVFKENLNFLKIVQRTRNRLEKKKCKNVAKKKAFISIEKQVEKNIQLIYSRKLPAQIDTPLARLIKSYDLALHLRKDLDYQKGTFVDDSFVTEALTLSLMEGHPTVALCADGGIVNIMTYSCQILLSRQFQKDNNQLFDRMRNNARHSPAMLYFGCDNDNVVERVNSRKVRPYITMSQIKETKPGASEKDLELNTSNFYRQAS